MKRNTFITTLTVLIVICILIGGLFYMVFPDPINTERFKVIKNIDHPETIELSKNKNQGYIHGLRLLITGKLDGKAIIKQGFSDSSFYRIDTIDNAVNLNYGGDWYQDNCLIIYKPLSVKTGELKLTYKFFGTNNP